MKYRSRTDIVAAILEVSNDGALKTRIMYSAFLSFPQLKEYLELLTDGGLLKYSEDERLYKTTEKGRRFLDLYKEIGSAIIPRIKKA